MRSQSVLAAALLVLTAAHAQDVPKPRIMVIATAAPGMDEQRDDEANSLLEQYFQNLGFQTIDATQLASIKDVDDALNAGDREKILALRTRYGCEVIVAVKYDKQFATGGSNPRGMWWYVFNGKAVRTDTAAQIASRSTKSARPRNSYNHFVDTAEIFAAEIGERIAAAWAREATQGVQIQLMVSKGDAAAFTALQQALLATPNVKACNQRRFQRDTAEYEVLYAGSTNDFVAALSGLQSPAVLVTGFEAARVDCEITSAPPPPPVDRTPPVVRIASPANGQLFNATRVTVQGTVDKPNVQQVHVNGVAAPVTGGNFTATVTLREGSNPIEAVAVDPAGNRGSDAISVLVDTVPPTVSIIAPQNGRKLNETQVNVGLTVTGDDIASVSVNGVPAELFRAPNTWKAVVTLKEGTNVEIRAVAYDRAGNAGTDRVLVDVNTRPPEVQGNVTVIVSGKVDDPSHKVTVNGKPVQVKADGTWQTTVDISESKIVTIIAEDDFGNQTVKVLDYSK